MPIMLNDQSAQNVKAVQAKSFNPKFFSQELTGAGKKVGVLNDAINPTALPAKNTRGLNPQINTDQKQKIVNGTVTTNVVPVSPLPMRAWSSIEKLEVPDITDYCLMAKGVNDEEVRIDVKPMCVILEIRQAQGYTDKKIQVAYQMVTYEWLDKTNTTFTHKSKKAGGNAFETAYTTCPASEYIKWQGRLPSYHFDANDWNQFITNYSVYNEIVKQSEIWQTTIDENIELLMQSSLSKSQSNPTQNASYYMEPVKEALKRLEMYTVPLDIYERIYANMTASLKPDIIKDLCKHNLNLLLSDTLTHLNANKAALPCLPPRAVMSKAGSNTFSKEQKEAIASTEPLIMVQAGAGTGKSTVILGRVDHMIGVGIDPQDIMVLSFTNAAADNITARNPSIKSMTIASMINTIYEANYPKHGLSNLDTIRNTLEICYGNSNVLATEFNRLLRLVGKNEAEAFTSLNNFIEDYTDEVIDMLETIKQTSLELQIIICYQQIDKLNEPAEIQSKYLIVDEVQDNSIFEFIYLLKYISKHNESMFIVGDCSQTLYEFRASNPRALNMLEGSGVFMAYKLQTNYRSNQAILDFANVALKDIAANQFALIQLQANSLAPVTLQSFTDAVTLQYEALAKLRNDIEFILSSVKTEIKQWMEPKLAAGEQVAFLAYARNKIYRIEEVLKEMYPNKVIANLVPDKIYATDIFTNFIKRYWDEIQFAPKQNVINIIGHGITDRLNYLTYDPQRSLPMVQRTLANWGQKYGQYIHDWSVQVDRGQMAFNDFLENVKWTMITYESEANKLAMSLKSRKNASRKKEQMNDKPDIILSTIHSAKGLEFENVVVVYQNRSPMNEPDKRMYYVALTRAMKSEYILAYDTLVRPTIVANYEQIIDELSVQAGLPKPSSQTKTVQIAPNVIGVQPHTAAHYLATVDMDDDEGAEGQMPAVDYGDSTDDDNGQGNPQDTGTLEEQTGPE